MRNQNLIYREIIFFLINGIIGFIIAMSCYLFLIYQGIDIDLSAAIGYVLGAVYLFFLNKKITFRDKSRVSYRIVLRYILLYLFSLFINVETNFLSYNILNNHPLSFTIAVSVSTIINFIGLKYFVFRLKRFIR